jgi:hypothetical protein
MQLTSYFQPNRFGHLLKKDLLFDQKRTWLVAGAAFIVLFVTILFWAYDGDNDAVTFANEFFPALLFGGGIFYTSLAFKELDEQNTGMLYLSLPASNFEKFFSKFLITTIGFVLFLIVSWWLFTAISGSIIKGFFDMEVYSFTPFDSENWLLIKVFFIVQSLFFLGAITFKKYTAVKTIASGFIASFLVIGVVLLIIRIVFYDYFDGFRPIGPQDANLRPSMWLQDFAMYSLKGFGKFMLWIVLPIFFWTVSYFKLTEKEI